ncbi:hypothetical protein H4R34_001387 [Dimargaris verticillata]|uniref:Uncharacterized protein n=1 Tax=Dimargaris verticillata TaxID=2761393 RepID=A0A9W8B4K2_9FUNG|nr:hypothetical protein H4R34_001387 [Dimargaris verticillata]
MPSPFPGIWDTIMGRSSSTKSYPVYEPALKSIEEDANQIIKQLTQDLDSCILSGQAQQLLSRINEICRSPDNSQQVHYIAYHLPNDNMLDVFEMPCLGPKGDVGDFLSADRFVTGSFQASPTGSAFVDLLAFTMTNFNLKSKTLTPC